jgi:hypothetical protein
MPSAQELDNHSGNLPTILRAGATIACGPFHLFSCVQCAYCVYAGGRPRGGVIAAESLALSPHCPQDDRRFCTSRAQVMHGRPARRPWFRGSASGVTARSRRTRQWIFSRSAGIDTAVSTCYRKRSMGGGLWEAAGNRFRLVGVVCAVSLRRGSRDGQGRRSPVRR